MAIENLSEEIEKVEAERQKRYPLIEIASDMEQIRLISERTLDYSVNMYPALKGLTMWEVIPRMAMEFMSQYFELAREKRSKDKNVMIHVANFLELGVEYGSTPGADKEGTFNSIIVLGDELKYDNDNPKNNVLKKEPPIIPDEDVEQIDIVCQKTKKVLHSMYGLLIEDHNNIWQITFNFFRQIRQWLIENKDIDNHVNINLGSILDIGIETSDTHDISFYDISASSPIFEFKPSNGDNVEYTIQFGSGQSFKLDSAKGDDITELDKKN